MTGKEYNDAIEVLVMATGDLQNELAGIPTEGARNLLAGLSNLQASIGELATYTDEESQVSEGDVFALEIASSGVTEYADTVAKVSEAYYANRNEMSGCGPVLALLVTMPFAAVAVLGFVLSI